MITIKDTVENLCGPVKKYSSGQEASYHAMQEGKETQRGRQWSPAHGDRGTAGHRGGRMHRVPAKFNNSPPAMVTIKAAAAVMATVAMVTATMVWVLCGGRRNPSDASSRKV